ncbi:MAG: porin family protein [Dysgonamonadaceae bacterium]|jgi:hypothetical protein|nr:porin family protein [Dysgonamonadaceae bacterium]
MKKIALILFLGFFALKSFAQAGDLTIGAQGGYITYYKNALYGLNLSYAPSDPLQLSLSSILNPKIIRADALNPNGQIENSLFALNLDARFLILNFDSWAVGPSVGVQYLHNKEKIMLENTYDRIGVNLGVYAKVNLTENLRLGGGWQYSSLKDSESYNMFYLSLGWAFNLR